jgi:hypothetical protein
MATWEENLPGRFRRRAAGSPYEAHEIAFGWVVASGRQARQTPMIVIVVALESA